MLVLRSLRRRELLWTREEFACYCFGNLGGRLSQRTLVRTVLLAVVATALAGVEARPSAELIPWVLEGVSAVAIAGVIVLIAHLPGLLKVNIHRHPLGALGE